MENKVKPIPEGYHTLTSYVVVKDVAQAIDFYQRAFGAKEIYRMADPEDEKSVIHAELEIGDSRLMLGEEMEGQPHRSAQSLGGSPVGFFVYVEDVDPAYKKAIDAGAQEVKGLTDMFWGDRCGTLSDPSGLQWTIATHKENLTPQQITERAKAFFESQKAA